MAAKDHYRISRKEASVSQDDCDNSVCSLVLVQVVQIVHSSRLTLTNVVYGTKSHGRFSMYEASSRACALQ